MFYVVYIYVFCRKFATRSFIQDQADKEEIEPEQMSKHAELLEIWSIFPFAITTATNFGLQTQSSADIMCKCQSDIAVVPLER